MAKLIKEEVSEVNFLTEMNNGKKEHYITGVFMQAEQKNKNGRVYPMHILQNEVDRYNRDYIKKNRAFGELGHPECFHDKTELLTVNGGWKLIKDVSVGEEVYTLNPNTNRVEVQKVINVTNEPFSGELISFNGRGFKTKVTPNHRFIVNTRGKLQFVTAQEALDNNLSHSFIVKTHNETDYSEDAIRIGDFEIDREVFFPFLAIYLSEGWTTHRKGRDQSYVIKIAQNVGPKADKFQDILDKLPFNFSKNFRREGKAIVWSCNNIDLAKELFPIGKSWEKYIPRKYLDSMTFKDATLFIEYYVLGDGRGSLKTKNTKCDVFSVSEKLIDDITQVALIAGIATRKYSKSDFKDYTFAGRTIEAKNKRPIYFCQLLNTKGTYLDKRFMSIDKEQYEGTIHCITVDNGTFYARDEGYTFWTGNSPTINLDRVSHMITSLSPEGTNFIGKAKILDTPNGKIVKSLLDGGANLGVSTRGVGSLKPQSGVQLVQDDFHLATAADIVADPSAPDAWVTGIMESADWVLTNAGWKPIQYEKARTMLKEASKSEIEDVALKLWTNYISKL
jgi:hypothetical protein